MQIGEGVEALSLPIVRLLLPRADPTGCLPPALDQTNAVRHGLVDLGPRGHKRLVWGFRCYRGAVGGAPSQCLPPVSLPRSCRYGEAQAVAERKLGGQAMRNHSRAGDCLLIAMILLNVLAWIWFPMTMAIWTASSFIEIGIYVWLRTPGRYWAMVRSYPIIPFRDE